MKIAIVGCGNMGMAFAKSFLQYDLVRRENLLLIEKSPERGAALQSEKAGVVVDTINDRVSGYDLVILSVKPQDFAVVQQELRPHLRYNQLVLSIMAGVSINNIQTALDHPLVVRAMPNTPAMLGMGMTAYAAASEVNIEYLRKIENLLNATGRSVFLEDETLLNAVTAVSGSGPAYFFYLVKAMIEAGKQMGFEESMAALLVKQTMLGSFHLIQTSDKSLDELIKAVASKGGTTEAALKAFEEGNLAKTLIGGLHAAQKRATELSAG